jgi:autophagy-related protein 9
LNNKKRLAQAHEPAVKYVSFFPFTMLTIIARFISFVAGSIVIVLLIFGLMSDDAMLNMNIVGDRSALWVLGVASTVVAICRQLIPTEAQVIDPEKLMEEIVQYTHHYPSSWKGKAHTFRVISFNFQYSFFCAFSSFLFVALKRVR